MINLLVYESFVPNKNPEKKFFTDSDIAYYEKLWKTMPYRYTENKFFASVWSQLKRNKALTKKQWEELEFLLKNGKSRYEAGQLPSNY